MQAFLALNLKVFFVLFCFLKLATTGISLYSHRSLVLKCGLCTVCLRVRKPCKRLSQVPWLLCILGSLATPRWALVIPDLGEGQRKCCQLTGRLPSKRSSQDYGSHSQASIPAVTIHCMTHSTLSLDLSESPGHIGLCE